MKVFVSLSGSTPMEKLIRSARGAKADKLRETKKGLSPKLRGLERRIETAEKKKDRTALKKLLKERTKLADQIDKINDQLADIGQDQKDAPRLKKAGGKVKRSPASSGAKPKASKTKADVLDKLAKNQHSDKDKMRLEWAAEALKSGDMDELKAALQGADTHQRETIMEHIHPKYWKTLGIKAVNYDQAVSDHTKKFGR